MVGEQWIHQISTSLKYNSTKTQRTTTLKSQKKSSTNSTGKKGTKSVGQSSTNKSSSRTTQRKLEENIKALTSVTPRKKTTKTSGTTAKAKGKSTPATEFRYQNSRKLNLFPHVETFPWFLENRKEDNKKCWFQCEDHVIKYVTRYNLYPIKDYKCLCYNQNQ